MAQDDESKKSSRREGLVARASPSSFLLALLCCLVTALRRHVSRDFGGSVPRWFISCRNAGPFPVLSSSFSSFFYFYLRRLSLPLLQPSPPTPISTPYLHPTPSLLSLLSPSLSFLLSSLLLDFIIPLLSPRILFECSSLLS